MRPMWTSVPDDTACEPGRPTERGRWTHQLTAKPATASTATPTKKVRRRFRPNSYSDRNPAPVWLAEICPREYSFRIRPVRQQGERHDEHARRRPVQDARL